MFKLLVNRFGIIITLLCATQSCFAGAKNMEPLTITGTIRVVGNEPFTHVVLTETDVSEKTSRARDYLIIGPLAEELRKRYQGHVVTLEGTICASPSPQFIKCFQPARIVTVKDGK